MQNNRPKPEMAISPSAAPTTTPSPAVTKTTTAIKTMIENATEGLSSRCFKLLSNRVLSGSRGKENVLTLCDLSIFFSNAKSFKEITRKDLLSFLDSYRKAENVDPLHKWIGTYNLFRMQLMRFFKWLYYPDVEQKKRLKPSVIENIPQLKRKEKSIYKPTDLWTPEDDALFLKYCPNPRERCYHAMSRDSAARPHELLKLRIKDVAFAIPSVTCKQFRNIPICPI